MLHKTETEEMEEREILPIRNNVWLNTSMYPSVEKQCVLLVLVHLADFFPNTSSPLTPKLLMTSLHPPLPKFSSRPDMLPYRLIP
ncbi:hypothetical protein GHT06_019462 [Daphnia sinensis]|uniref:Uncharacterized protein n=1 Tax=Daphnia sinensis TaxID=1820382 RepID=A0AAD5PT46_9CRUS|nr:hypothetical protein GHT06_019462 [Daphnia sinensis]